MQPKSYRLGVQALVDGFAPFSVLSMLLGTAVMFETVYYSTQAMIMWLILFFVCLARALDT